MTRLKRRLAAVSGETERGGQIAADDEAYLAKAAENLACARSELAAGRYNTCVSRAYYAAFFAAMAALVRADVRPIGAWEHAFVASRFSGVLINQRHLYNRELSSVLTDLMIARHTADYATTDVGRKRAERAVPRAERIIRAVIDHGARA